MDYNPIFSFLGAKNNLTRWEPRLWVLAFEAVYGKCQPSHHAAASMAGRTRLNLTQGISLFFWIDGKSGWVILACGMCPFPVDTCTIVVMKSHKFITFRFSDITLPLDTPLFGTCGAIKLRESFWQSTIWGVLTLSWGVCWSRGGDILEVFEGMFSMCACACESATADNKVTHCCFVSSCKYFGVVDFEQLKMENI